MEIVRDRAGLKRALQALRAEAPRLALVPTMGNLHAGHLSLMAHAQAAGCAAVATVFINPLQFDRPEDLAAYPRTFEADVSLMAQAGVRLLFAPEADTMYPRGLADSARVEVPGLGTLLCGAHRPGHFQGVATVVSLLFNLVRPNLAVFGEKDFQQLLIIRRLAEDLAFDIDIVGCPTVREADGLAMSSRNRYLTAAERALAPQLYAALKWVREQVQGGRRDFSDLEAEAAERIAAAGLNPDYMAVRSERDLGSPSDQDLTLRVLGAAWLGRARLIDNLALRLLPSG